MPPQVVQERHLLRQSSEHTSDPLVRDQFARERPASTNPLATFDPYWQHWDHWHIEKHSETKVRRVWDPHGILLQETVYQEESLVALKYFHQNGNLSEEIRWEDNGSRRERTFYSNGTLKFEHICEANRTIRRNRCLESHSFHEITLLGGTQRIGTILCYHPSGRLRRRCTAIYRCGEESAQWQTFDSEGQVVARWSTRWIPAWGEIGALYSR